ncbi:hypothetical protein AM588_10007352 [Phytophthora nicotianae]|uniref:Flagella associated protein n=1 Tax=Phytophthora nicotianae TaxID=4792 RepID=A0A0W8D551_PHYNI|nr:hypothetical protein AM588_10007352 [Phytophthora nicotianae]
MASNFELDHAYLRQTVGAPLTEAMAQLAILQPEDPVEFLGNYLLKHVANVETQQKLQKQKQRPGLVTPHPVDTEQQQHQLEWEKVLEEEKQVHDQLHNEPSMVLVFQRFLEWICSMLNAEEAYIGRKCVDPQGNCVIHFIASSKHPQSTVVDNFVAQPTDEGDEEGVRRGIGVTFDVFKEIVPTDEDGNPAVDTEGNALPASPPKFVHIENVLREPRVKFFGVPKLGALLARAGQYKSYLHADVRNESNPEEPNVLEQWLVFSADTIGQARPFTKKEIDRFRHATELFLTTLEETERALYIKDNERCLSNDEPLLREFLVAFAAQVAVQEENLAAQLPGPPEGEELSEAAQQQRAAKDAELRLSFLMTLLVSHIPTLSLASARVVPFKGFVLTTFAAALELLGYTRRELYNPATGQPSWDKISPLLVAQAKQNLAEIAKADVDTASPVASCFYMWSLAVVARAESITAMAEQAQQLEDETVAAAAGDDA